MFKTLSVAIGKIPFVIEEQAYAKLDQYLRAIRAHFSTADADEIVSDIESRMAEELSDALGKNRKVVEMKDIDAAIAQMGTIEDFRQFDDGQQKSAPKEEPFSFKKVRMYRDADNQIIGGVCAGIANYFDIDPIFIRLAFGLSMLLGGFGILLYIILWFALPEAKTTAQKVEMTGGKVTLSALQKKIDDVVPPAKRKGAAGKIVAFPFQVIGAVFRWILAVLKVIVPFLARVIGGLIAIACAFAIAALTFVLLSLLLNPSSPYIGLPLQEVVGTTAYITLLLCGYFVAFLPVLLILLLGASLLAMRSTVSVASLIALTVVWFGAGTVGATTLFSVAPKLEPVIEQYEETTQRTFEIENSTGIAADGIQRVTVTRGDKFSVMLEGTDRAMALLTPKLEDGVLSLQAAEDHDPCILLCHSRHATLYVTMPQLETATARDASRIGIDGFASGNMTLFAQDIGRIEANVTPRQIIVNIKDSSSIDLSGAAEGMTAAVQDIGRLRAEEFIVNDALITAKDMARARINVRNSLKANEEDMSSIENVAD